MALIKQIYDALKRGDLQEPFTVYDIRVWVEEQEIVKDDGEAYAESSIRSILSNSDIKNFPSSNLNAKPLHSRVNNAGLHEYWFDSDWNAR